MDKAFGGEVKLLLAEDSVPDIVLFRRIMPPDWSVTVVSDGTVALEQAQTSDWTVIVLDDVLPNLTGFQVAERLIAEPHPPIIIWSGMLPDVARDRAMRLGIAFVSKHERLDALVQTVRGLIR